MGPLNHSSFLTNLSGNWPLDNSSAGFYLEEIWRQCSIFVFSCVSEILFDTQVLNVFGLADIQRNTISESVQKLVGSILIQREFWTISYKLVNNKAPHNSNRGMVNLFKGVFYFRARIPSVFFTMDCERTTHNIKMRFFLLDLYNIYLAVFSI